MYNVDVCHVTLIYKHTYFLSAMIFFPKPDHVVLVPFQLKTSTVKGHIRAILSSTSRGANSGNTLVGCRIHRLEQTTYVVVLVV